MLRGSLAVPLVLQTRTGDCDNGKIVTVDEALILVNIALGEAPPYGR